MAEGCFFNFWELKQMTDTLHGECKYYISLFFKNITEDLAKHFLSVRYSV